MAVLNLHHYGAPDGAPTLAIHGVTAHGERYRRLAQEAFPERRWLSVDLRGHGRSTWDGPWTVERHVADLLETLDAAGVDRVDVVGHSYGGMISLHLLATAPGRIRRVALLDPAIELPGAWLPKLADEMIEDPGWATPEEALAKRLEGRPPQAIADATEDVQRHVYEAPDGRWRMRFQRGAAIAAWSEMARTTASVAHAQRPLLLVVARQEEIVRPELRASLARDLGDRLTTVEIDCGHMVYWDAFDETAAALRSFLGDRGMSERTRISSGSKFERDIGYSRAVVDGDWIFVSGTTGFDYATMTISDDVAEQADQTLRTIAAALAEAGSSLDDVVRVRYLLPDADDFEACWPAFSRHLGVALPAATMMVVGLADPRMKIEIEVTARKQS